MKSVSEFIGIWLPYRIAIDNPDCVQQIIPVWLGIGLYRQRSLMALKEIKAATMLEF